MTWHLRCAPRASPPGDATLLGVLASLLCATACHAPPVSGPLDAGVAHLQGVSLERILADSTVLSVTAPRAELALDGQMARLWEPRGTLAAGQQGGGLRLEAARMDAQLQQGTFVLWDARLQDPQGRWARAPRVTTLADGGGLWADPPVTVDGPNWRAVAQGGARFEPGVEGSLILAGPVEAQAWPVDAGAAILPPRAP